MACQSQRWTCCRSAFTLKPARRTACANAPTKRKPPNPMSQPPSLKDGSRKHQLSECYERGVHLSTCDKNFGYAHAMFAACVLQEPGNLQFVEAMVLNLRASRPHRTKSLLNWRLGRSRRLSKAIGRKEWAEVFRVGVDILKANPWDVPTLRAMAEACAALHHNEAELVYLKQALDAEPRNLGVNRHCARSLGRMGQFDQAIACWHRIEKLAGQDKEATRMISTLAEEKLRYPGGRPPAAQATTRHVRTEELDRGEPEEPSKDIVVRPEQRLEQAIAQDPQNIRNYLELTAILIESARFHAAETLLRRAIATCGKEPALLDQWDRVRNLLAEEQRQLNEARLVEQNLSDAPIRIPWLALAIGSTVALLVLQLIPSAGAAVWRIVDFRNWSPTVGLTLVLVGLLAIRVGPRVRSQLRRWKVGRIRRASNRKGVWSKS